MFVLGESIDFSAIEDANARLRRHVSEQHRLEELLVDPVSVFRRWPKRVRARRSACSSLASRRDRDARQLRSEDARRRDDVVRIVGRKPYAAQLVSGPKAAKDFHGAS